MMFLIVSVSFVIFVYFVDNGFFRVYHFCFIWKARICGR